MQRAGACSNGFIGGSGYNVPMDGSFILKGLLLGFSIAAPVGPIGVLCIRRTVAEGRASGLVSGLGAATADAVYGCVAAFGLTFISNLILGLHTWLNLLGGLFLCYLGVRTFLSVPAEEAAPAGGTGLWRSYLTTFGLTLTNPMTILSFAATFAGTGLAEVSSAADGYRGSATLVLGVFAGSALWWLLLSGLVGLLRERLDARALRWLNRVSGLVLFGFGAWSLARLFTSWPA
jgi:threonine/homoserine/homoserine lactone efflux protein